MPLVPHRDIIWDDAVVDADSPSVLTAWAPSDDFNAFTFESDTAIGNLVGIVPTRDGRPIWISYTGTQNLRILHENGGADDEEYRILCPGGVEIQLFNNDTALLWYSTYNKRWRAIAGKAPVAPTADPYPTLYKVLNASAAAANSSTDQPWFPSAGGVSVEADTLYRFEGTLIVSHGTTSTAFGIGFGGTATTNFISYQGTAVKRVMNTNGNNAQMAVSDNAANLQTTTTNTVGGSVLTTTGILSVNAAGTLIPRFRFSAAPGGIPAVRAGTHFQLTKLGADTDLTRGTWA